MFLMIICMQLFIKRWLPTFCEMTSPFRKTKEGIWSSNVLGTHSVNVGFLYIACVIRGDCGWGCRTVYFTSQTANQSIKFNIKLRNFNKLEIVLVSVFLFIILERYRVTRLLVVKGFICLNFISVWLCCSIIEAIASYELVRMVYYICF